MSTQAHDGEVIELTCRVGELQITIKGPAGSATQLFREITARNSGGGDSPGASTERSFSVVSSAPAARPTSSSDRVLETRSQIQASFAECPAYLVQQGNRLAGSSTSGADRVRRAWLAGPWAQATLAGRSISPNRSVQLDLRSRYYAVLRADGLGRPAIFQSAKSYWKTVGDLASSTSISHAFPSEQEARVYLAGASVADFDLLA